MYELALTTSHSPAQSDIEVREITIGELLHEVAAARADAEALVEIRQDGSMGRCWTYSELLADAERPGLIRRMYGYEPVMWRPGEAFGPGENPLIHGAAKRRDEHRAMY